MPSGGKKGSKSRTRLKKLAVESALTVGKKRLGRRNFKGTKKCIKCYADQKVVCRPKKYMTKKRKKKHRKQLNMSDIERSLNEPFGFVDERYLK
jgi:hypothetical protein